MYIFPYSCHIQDMLILKHNILLDFFLNLKLLNFIRFLAVLLR